MMRLYTREEFSNNSGDDSAFTRRIQRAEYTIQLPRARGPVAKYAQWFSIKHSLATKKNLIF